MVKFDNAKAVCSFKYSIDGNVEFVMWKLLEPRWIRMTYFFFYCARWFLWLVLSAAESTINAGNAKKRWITSTDLVGLYSKSDGSGGWRRWLWTNTIAINLRTIHFGLGHSDFVGYLLARIHDKRHIAPSSKKYNSTHQQKYSTIFVFFYRVPYKFSVDMCECVLSLVPSCNGMFPYRWDGGNEPADNRENE